MKIELLTREAFAPFGEVIETLNARSFAINNGYATRYDALALAEVGEGSAKISLFAARPRPLPLLIDKMERHPLGSQAFYPLQNDDWLVVVCDDPKEALSFRCFRASGHQGINYARGTWHFPLLVMKAAQFVVVDREGPGNNLEEYVLGTALVVSP